MTQMNYPYLDLTVLAQIRPHLLAPYGAVLFDTDLKQILWVNGEGAKLVGSSRVRRALEEPVSPNRAMMRQITTAVGKLSSHEDAHAVMRISQGFQSQLIGFSVRLISLPQGEKAVLMLTENLHDRRHSKEKMAQATVEGLDGYSHASAILDEQGVIIAASEHFRTLAVSNSNLKALTNEVAVEEDRLVKRLIETNQGDLPTGIARLSDDPACHLVIIANPTEEENLEGVEPETAITQGVERNQKPEELDDGEVLDSADSGKAERPSVLIQEFQHSPIPKKTTVKEQDLAQEIDADDEDSVEQQHNKEIENSTTSPDPAPVRFVWEMDADNEFRSVSQELATAVGREYSDIVGMSWIEVSEKFGLENGNSINELLKLEDTWSGKTVLWPVQGTDLRVPIDLAGLPSYGRSRNFEGFNGFGIIRIGDAVVETIKDEPVKDEPKEDSFQEAATKESSSKTIGFLTGAKKSDFDKIVTETEPQSGNDNIVVDLDEHRESTERLLSADEQETFQEIAEKLTKKTNGNTTGQNNLEKTQVRPSQTTKIKIPNHSVDTSILARLPIPVLVYRDNELLFGNEQFFKLTGYQNLEELAEAGGVDALFGATAIDPESSHALVYHVNGNKLDVQAHLQRVPWDINRAMLLTLREENDDRDDTPEANRSTNTPIKSSARDNSTTPDYSTESRSDILQSKTIGTKTLDVTAASKNYEAFGGLGTEDLRSILDTATDGIIILSDEGVVRALNKSAEALFDVEAGEIVDRNFTKLLAIESHRSALDYVTSISGTGVASVLNDGREVIGRTSKGGFIPLFMTIGKLEKTDACCAVMRDITQWKKSEEELVTAKSQAELASTQKTEFLTKVSHEIRTPLNAIIGFSDIMIEERFGKIDNNRYRGYLRDIHRSGNHVLELINDLLDISKIEAGKMDLEFDACDLNTIVSETVALTQPDANKERVIIRTSLSAMVPKVVADPRSLRQIILNLVSNSIKFTKTGGQVIVSTVYEESGEVVLRVRDTGVGMSELELVRALKPYQQIGGNTDTEQQGTGLGLPLTKAMVEANRAQFHIESEPEEGTLVEIHFPTQRVLADR